MATQTEWLTVAEAAARAGVSPTTVQRAVANGQLRSYRTGHRRARFHAPDVDRWAEHRNPPTGETTP